MLQLGYAAVPCLVLTDKAHRAVLDGQAVHAAGVQRRDGVRVDVPGRGLLVKQAAGLGAAVLQRQVHLADAQVLNFAVRLAGRKGAKLTRRITPAGPVLPLRGVALTNTGSPLPHQPGAPGSW